MENSKKIQGPIAQKNSLHAQLEDDESYEEEEEEYESEDSLSTMPAEYVKMATTARVLFED